jgi:hypothetical protein
MLECVRLLVKSPRAIDASHAALVCDVLAADADLQAGRDIVAFLTVELEKQVHLARDGFASSAAVAPLHGLLQCQRRIVPLMVARKVYDRELLDRISALACEVTRLMVPFVGNAAPEGFLPSEDRPTTDVIQEEADDDADDASKPQLVLLCSWRSMKEASLLLSALITNLPWPISEGDTTLMKATSIVDVADLFVNLLLTARHRGAVDMVHTAFLAVCQRLWQAAHPTLKALPQRWTAMCMDYIGSADDDSTTRRSAGLPLLLLAVLSTEPHPRANLALVMDRLLAAVGASGSVASQVHSLNILRMLIRDSTLVNDAAGRVAECMAVAVAGFGKEIFGVRNSSMMLFSALMQRMFGVKKSRDEHAIRNRLHTREFFARYPSLRSVLLECLQLSVESSQLLVADRSPLYACLLVLSRLVPAPLRAVDDNVEEFLTPLLRCCARFVTNTG